MLVPIYRDAWKKIEDEYERTVKCSHAGGKGLPARGNRLTRFPDASIFDTREIIPPIRVSARFRKRENHGMNRPFFIMAVFFSLFPRAESNAIPLISSVSASVGAIGTFQRDDPAYSNSYASYPEIQISGGFFRQSLSWIAFTGFWDDGIDTPAMSSGSITYSFGGTIFGARVLFKPRETSENWPSPRGGFRGSLPPCDPCGICRRSRSRLPSSRRYPAEFQHL